jgi:phosphopantothenoylcysteine decarboxylase / phosphopantothenate---cysteine ligase
MMAKEKRVLLIIGGGIAAFKSLELIRLLQKGDIKVRVILTHAAKHFVTPLSLATLTKDRVYEDLFSLTDEAEIGHIELSRDADLIVVAPATADLLAKSAHGLAHDLASTVLLATNKNVLVAPAMNVRMWHHQATQRNISQLRDNGYLFVGPDEGEMACGEYGLGRMSEPAAIAQAIFYHLNHHTISTHSHLANLHVVVTSGPTREAIDPVRYMSNHSSGKQGHAIAQAFARAGARVTLISGPVSLPDPLGVTTHHVISADEMYNAVKEILPCDIFIGAAAVADWRLETQHKSKIKKSSSAPILSLTENVDILSYVGHSIHRPRLVIGFAAETHDLIAHAQKKLSSKKCDVILANDVAAEDIFGSDMNHVHFITSHGVEEWQRASKQDIADNLVRFVDDYFSRVRL